MVDDRFFLFVTIFVIFSFQASAQSVCGDAPPVANERTRLELKSTAQSRVNEHGSANFFSALERDRTDIFARYPNEARATAYYQYVVCGLLEQDKSMSATQKVENLNKAFRALFTGSAKSYAEYYFLVVNTYGQEKRIVKATLKRDGDKWLEIQLGKVIFVWKEMTRNDDYILILHEPRQLQIKIPVNGGASLMGYVGEDWQVWNEMHPVQ